MTCLSLFSKTLVTERGFAQDADLVFTIWNKSKESNLISAACQATQTPLPRPGVPGEHKPSDHLSHMAFNFMSKHMTDVHHPQRSTFRAPNPKQIIHGSTRDRENVDVPMRG